MPLRVKCRCGQELVLRYSDWVYAILGVALIALLLNSLALLLVYLRLESLGLPVAQVQAPEAHPAPSREARADRQAIPATQGGAPLPEPARAEPPAPAAPPSPPGGASGAPTPASGPEVKPTDEVAPPPAPATSPISTGDSGGSAWLGRSALVRLLAVERARGALLWGFLLDPDERIRQRALDLLAESSPGALEVEAHGAILLAAATPLLSSSDPGRKLLEAARRTAPQAPPAASEDLPGVLRLLRSEAEASLAGEPVLSLQKRLEEAQRVGLDVVLVVDTSRSMEGALEALAREAVWLFRCLPWAVPGVRLGLVLYRDRVEAVSNLSEAPDREPLRLLSQSKAEGGGDVPEAVHEALRAALSLGRMSWRDGAEKEIVLVGDAPPPFEEVEKLLSLMRLAFKQGGYRLHALSLRPDEGRPAVPFFPEFAAAAGGRCVTVSDPDAVGGVVLLSLFPEATHAVLSAVVPRLKELFSS